MKSKYDKNTQRQLKNIDQDASIKELTTAVNDLKTRIVVLEDARQVQIRINADVLNSLVKIAPKTELSKPEKQSLWDRIWNKT